MLLLLATVGGWALGSSGGAEAGKAPRPHLDWHACPERLGFEGPGFQCSTLRVPLADSRGGGRTAGLLVARHLPAGKSDGVLFVNPGGPGVSGVSSISPEGSTEGLYSHFEVVSFDPLGVAGSEGIECLRGRAFARYVQMDPDPPTADGVDRLIDAQRRFARACERRAGPILDSTTTVDAARDMDLIRRALGLRKINYLGYSYGTLLGATYAQLYGSHLRAMVLDGPLDPRIPMGSLRFARLQGRGLTEQFLHFAAWCRRQKTCHWRPAGDPLVAFSNLEDRLRAHPLKVGPAGKLPPYYPGFARRVGPAELLTAAEGPLLLGRYGWEGLGQTLVDLEHGKGEATLSAVSQTYSVVTIGGLDATQCSDSPPIPPAQARRGALTPSPADPFDLPGLPINAELQCATWPLARTAPVRAIHAPDAPTILVVASRRDPATPYGGARALAAQLDHAVLLTRVGDGHTSYAFSACVKRKVNGYLTHLKVPRDGTRCSSKI